MKLATKQIIHKLENLPENMVNEVVDFIGFLKAKHAKSISSLLIVEEPRAIWLRKRIIDHP
jgi:hypothetical protein